MKNESTTFLILAIAAFLLFRQNSAPTQVQNTSYPPEPSKVSEEWTKWVQRVVNIAGGLQPSLFSVNQPFQNIDPKIISAAAFGNFNPYLNNSYFQSEWVTLPVYWNQVSPYYN